MLPVTDAEGFGEHITLLNRTFYESFNDFVAVPLELVILAIERSPHVRDARDGALNVFIQRQHLPSNSFSYLQMD